ncbi:7-cyano-7-deazaguanine synthase [Micromonospora sp. NPDC005305]|uniref:7-cyano-7-deazaguanine synthase n=1 Tax=Micromonospora sp. NPDC005305 TaxID=3156875 RepID=UPI0033BDAB7B
MVIAVVSGGMDSVTMAHQLHSDGHVLFLLSVDYGQRHLKEHRFAAATAQRLGVRHEVADLSPVARFLKGSSLTDPDVDVPERSWSSFGESPNIVPNRNALLLSVAFAVAVAERADAVAIGTVANDHASVPDSTPEFLESFIAMERIATAGHASPELDLLAPLSHVGKTGVIEIGERLGVPWLDTWSCFRGGDLHCARCAACTERREAFTATGITDPTRYEERGA